MLVSHAGQRVRERNAEREAEREPGAELRGAAREEAAQHARIGRAERAAHADLADALADAESHDAVKARAGEQQRDEAERAEPLRDDALAVGDARMSVR